LTNSVPGPIETGSRPESFMGGTVRFTVFEVIDRF
jgi:hypothetical protein